MRKIYRAVSKKGKEVFGRSIHRNTPNPYNPEKYILLPLSNQAQSYNVKQDSISIIILYKEDEYKLATSLRQDFNLEKLHEMELVSDIDIELGKELKDMGSSLAIAFFQLKEPEKVESRF